MDSSTNYFKIGRIILYVVAVVLVAQTMLFARHMKSLNNQNENNFIGKFKKENPKHLNKKVLKTDLTIVKY